MMIYFGILTLCLVNLFVAYFFAYLGSKGYWVENYGETFDLILYYIVTVEVSVVALMAIILVISL